MPAQEIPRIADLQLNQQVTVYLRLGALERRQKKDGSPYLTVQFQDRSGRIEAKIWDKADEYQRLLVCGRDYQVRATVTSYQGKLELKPETINPAKAGDEGYQAAELEEGAPFDVDAAYAAMTGLLQQHLKTPAALAVLRRFDELYGPRFRDHYGAQRIHHAHRGGLLAHTGKMIQLCLLLADHYPVDTELLLLGALFHDLGKLEEFSVSPAVEQTPSGGLVGHIVLGVIMFRKLLDGLDEVPADWALQIEHLIVSHHGEKEFGSPELPKTPEAMILHIVDLLDSKLGIIYQQLREDAGPGVFTEYVRVLGRCLYRGPREPK